MEVSIPSTMTEFANIFHRQRDQQRLYHFVMHLHPEFESLHGQILHHSPLPSLTETLAEFIIEKTWLRMLPGLVRISIGSSKMALTSSNKNQPSRD